MMDAETEKIREWIDANRRFVLLSHVRPDGDAIGSQLALGLALEAAGKEVRLINEDGLPDNLRFMAESGRIETPPSGPLETDVVIALDTANKPRLGERALAAVGHCEKWINIDHHRSNPGYGQLNLIDPNSPATGQILYRLILALDLPLPAAARDAIYVAVSTDTGSFQYSATTAETYEMAADLVRRGANVGELNALTYDNYPLRRLRLLQALLETLDLRAGGRLASWELTQATAGNLGVKPEDSEGLIDTIRAIQDVQVAVFFEELPKGGTRISMRSKTPRIDVCELCAQFGGGGHAQAAGIRMSEDLDTARGLVLAAAEKRLATL